MVMNNIDKRIVVLSAGGTAGHVFPAAALLKELASQEAFGRAAEVWEVANVIIFLASEYSSYMTGEIVPVSSQRA